MTRFVIKPVQPNEKTDLRPRDRTVIVRGSHHSKIHFQHLTETLTRLLLTPVLLGICCVPLITAEDVLAESFEEPNVLEEIIVTATRRSENILEVPMSITAFSGQSIKDLNLTNRNDLEQLVPGLQFGDENEKQGHGTVIRGIGSRLYGQTHGDQAVAYYVDGVYTSSPYGITPGLFDIERIEVARGPQGTLHGRNSIAGTLSFVTRRPTDEWDFTLQIEATDQPSMRYNLAFGGPLTDQLSYRITGGYHDGDGAQKNIGLGKDYDAPHEKFGAAQLRYKTDRVDINLRYSYLDDTGIPRTPVTLEGYTTTSEFDTSGGPHPWYLYPEELPASSNCSPDEILSLCKKLENKVNLNRSGSRDSSRETLTLHTDFNISETMALRYTFGFGDIDETFSNDFDRYNRVGGWAGTNWAHRIEFHNPPNGIIPGDVDGIPGAHLVGPDPGLYSLNPLLLSADAGTSVRDVLQTVSLLTKENSHELVLLSDLEGDFDFLVGAFYYENETAARLLTQEYTSIYRYLDAETFWPILQTFGVENFFPPFYGNTPFANCDEFAAVAGRNWFATEKMICAPGNDHLNANVGGNQAESETKAIFTNFDYRFNDAWRLSGGVRWTEDNKKLISHEGYYTSSFTGIPLRGFYETAQNQNRKWDAVIWNINAEFRPSSDNTMYYGRISTGYRPGGFHPFPDIELTEFIDQEDLINYEIGVKSSQIDGRLHISAVAFYNSYDGFQINLLQEYPEGTELSRFAPSPLAEYTANVDGTKIWGFEFEAAYLINENWRISGFYNYLDSELGTHRSVTPGDPNPQYGEWAHLIVPFEGAAPVEIVSLYQLPTEKTGNKLPMQPKHKFALTAEYTKPLQDLGLLDISSTYSYTGKRHPYIGNLPSQEMRAYGRWDIRVNWTFRNGRWSVGVFVKNLLNDIGLVEYVPTNGNVIFESPTVATLTEQRRLGMVVRLNW